MSRVFPMFPRRSNALQRTSAIPRNINATCHGLCARQLDWLQDRSVIVLRVVHARRYRPWAHQLGQLWPHEVARVGVVAEPARVVVRRDDDRHAVVDVGEQPQRLRRQSSTLIRGWSIARGVLIGGPNAAISG
jgi:hypothetical protein